ncbi:MAG: hypothetical protein RIT37_982, partial [Bacteroidota bacterium]
MDLFKARLDEKLPQLRAERTTLLKEHGDTQISTVAIEQVLGGMRAVPALLCETSSVSADEGLRIRNIPILELTNQTPEDIFFLLCTGVLPND